MGSFVLDFSAYNALLASNGHGSSYYGADDAFLGGGDPGLSGLAGRRAFHHLQHQQQQQQQQQNQHQQQQQHQQQLHGTGLNANNSHPRRQVSSRFLVYDRNSVDRLRAELALQTRRKQQIANFGHTWLKPPGVPKTLFQIREECREQEEQAEAERREELAQQLAQAEAAAALGAEGEGETGGAELGAEGSEPAGGDAERAAAGGGVDTDMAEGDGIDGEDEQDLDNDIPDADGDEFSFGNNNDDEEDDPFASSTAVSSSGEESDGSEEADSDSEGNQEDVEGRDEDEDAEAPGNYTHSGPAAAQAASAHLRVSGHGGGPPGGAAAQYTTPTRTVEDQREQARARAAERREMRQIRATEDRVRAMLAHPRLSGMGPYGEEDDLDEEDEAQMLQEDDLVRDASGAGRGPGHGNNDNNNNTRFAGGQQNDRMSNMIRSSLDGQVEAAEAYLGVGGGGVEDDDGMEMDMDADLDDGIPEGSSAVGAMDLSTFDGGYEHTDTEAELSSSIGDVSGLHHHQLGAGGDVGTQTQEDDDLPHHSFLAAGLATSGSLGGIGNLSMAPRSSGNRYRGSLARSDRNSLDISSLLSRDGSSNVGSSPQMRRL